MKLDCLSSGGRPAPRNEWLNVSSAALTASPGGSSPSEGGLGYQTLPEVQLMRNHWPQKKSTFVDSSAFTSATSGSAQATIPITSSSVTISVTRYDLNSHFVCLVLPAPAEVQPGGSHQATNLEQLIKNPAYLAALLASAADQQQRAASQHQSAPMFKWIKLDVQG